MALSYMKQEDYNRIELKLAKSRLSFINPVAGEHMKEGVGVSLDDAALASFRCKLSPIERDWLVSCEYDHELTLKAAQSQSTAFVRGVAERLGHKVVGSTPELTRYEANGVSEAFHG